RFLPRSARHSSPTRRSSDLRAPRSAGTRRGSRLTAGVGARLLEGAPFAEDIRAGVARDVATYTAEQGHPPGLAVVICGRDAPSIDRKSTRLNSSHDQISYAV